MNKIKLNIWGRDFELKVSYDVFEGEQITENQKKALQDFLKNTNLIDSCKSKVEEYCKSNTNGNTIDTPISNIFKYVIPTDLYIMRPKDSSNMVALMCNFKFDSEHGIAIVFKNNKYKEIGEQGIVL